MSVNQNHWGAKPYQFAFVTTVLVALAKARKKKWDLHLDLDNETKCDLLHFAWN
jgi:hypothetical protein